MLEWPHCVELKTVSLKADELYNYCILSRARSAKERDIYMVEQSYPLLFLFPSKNPNLADA